MKLLALISILMSFNVSAQTLLNFEDQKVIVEKIAKSERRELWKRGFERVSSSVSNLSQAQIDELPFDNEYYEEPLTPTQITSISNCFKRTKHCSLFLISLTANQMGGSGEWLIWIMMNPNTGSVESIKHFVYAE